MRKLLYLYLLVSGVLPLAAQISVGADTLYGPEWLRSDQPYLRIPVAEEGLYRITPEQLARQGWPVTTTAAARYQLWCRGEEVPLYVSADGSLAAGDYLAFYGLPNRGELDAHLYADATSEQLNPAVSLITDTAAYFLTLVPAGQPTARYARIDNNLGNPPAPAPYVWRTTEVVYRNAFLKEYFRISGVTVYYSHPTVAEGYGSRSINDLLSEDGSTATALELPLQSVYTAGPMAQLSLRYGLGPGTHHQVLRLAGTDLFSERTTGWSVRQPVVDIPAAALTGNRLSLELTGLADARDKAAVAYAQLRYPARPSAAGQSSWTFEVAASAFPINLVIEDFPLSAGTPVIYDRTSGQRLVAARVGSSVQVRLPVAATARALLLVGTQSGWRSSAPVPVRLPDLTTAPTDYLILTSERLNGGQLAAYESYRQSAAGGSYRVRTVQIEDLYDAFSYGVARHPLAVRHYVQWLRRQQPDLQHIFIVGKGREYVAVRTADQLVAARDNFFVPSLGYPASDNLLVAARGERVSRVAVGRLPVVSADEIAVYLNKMRAVEMQTTAPQTIPDRDWMKQVLHLGGGGPTFEQVQIRALLRNMEQQIERNRFGGEVTAFYKTSSDPIETSQTQQIFGRINAGTSIVTFFGHSSPGTFEFNIDNPDNYDNAGREPLMISLGCYSGNSFLDFRSIGERFILQERGGAAAFAASLGVGFIDVLGEFGKQLYITAGGDAYGLGSGEIIRRTLSHYANRTDYRYATLVEQFSLLGDPAFRLHPSPGPDYTPDPASLVVTPNPLTPLADSLSVTVRIVNLGQYQRDSLGLRFERELPRGTRLPLGEFRVPTPPYAATHTFALPFTERQALGLNRLHLTLDPNNEIAEAPAPAAEANNTLGATGAPFFVLANTARPLYPLPYALVPKADISLRAATSDALADERTYLFQLDTTPRFAPPLGSTSLRQRGGLLRWQPDVNWQPGRTYYWRVSPDSTETASSTYAWEQSSFTYRPDLPAGWGQEHWGQWQQNQLTDIEAVGPQLQFVRNVTDFQLRQLVYGGDPRPDGFVNGQRWSDFFRWNILESMQVVVVDTLGRFWRNANPGQYGSVNTSTQVAIAAFSFPVSTTQERANLINFVEEVVPTGHLVIIYPALRDRSRHLNVADWAADSLALDGRNLFNVLEAQGAQQIRDLQAGMRPYVLAFRKDGGRLEEQLAANQDGVINVNFALDGFWREGQIRSPWIGPAQEWQQLVWQHPLLEPSDTVQVQLYGRTPDNQSVLLRDSLLATGNLSLTDIDAATYPYLRLELLAEDRYENTLPPPGHWRIFYTGVPDLALYAGTDFALPDTVPQGQAVVLDLVVENTGPLPMDTTHLRLTTLVNGTERQQTYPVPALSPGASQQLSVTVPTEAIEQRGQLLLLLNPSDDPREQYRFNNQAARNLAVERDVVAPVLSVTFDGQRIMDGDLVSARPYVRIELTDENPFRLLVDSSLLTLEVVTPDGSSRRLPLDGTEARFVPATATRNQAVVEWQPTLTQDGTYELRVMARDASGNVSGRLEYRVHFEVIRQRMLSHLVPYPNPFTTTTQFVYTLTGDAPLEDYRLQIMTISGRVVREISGLEAGPLRVGTHRLDYPWDGTDSYGDRLANGVYLYRLLAEDTSGEPIKYYENGTGQYFRNGIGKVVLLR